MKPLAFTNYASIKLILYEDFFWGGVIITIVQPCLPALGFAASEQAGSTRLNMDIIINIVDVLLL